MANFSEFDNFDVDKDPLIRRAAAEDEFDDEEEFVHEPSLFCLFACDENPMKSSTVVKISSQIRQDCYDLDCENFAWHHTYHRRRLDQF